MKKVELKKDGHGVSFQLQEGGTYDVVTWDPWHGIGPEGLTRQQVTQFRDDLTKLLEEE